MSDPIHGKNPIKAQPAAETKQQREAEKQNMKSLLKKKIRILTYLPKGKKTHTVIFKEMCYGKYDKDFALVIKHESIGILLSTAAFRKLLMEHLDIKTDDDLKDKIFQVLKNQVKKHP